MAGPLRATITVDGAKVDAFEVRFSVHTDQDQAGMPVHQSLGTAVHAYFDVNDRTQFPHASLKKFFDLANVPTNEKVKDIKVEVWADDARKDCLYSLKFKGWIKSYDILTPYTGENRTEAYNTVLHVLLTPVVNREKFQDVNFGN